MTYGELVAELTVEDLRRLTNGMIDYQLELITECTDADVVFVPDDPEANDTFAVDASEVDLAWTLGHVIVHTTASSEESAAIAVELARGVPYRVGRSRSEVPWETVMTIEQCRHRLQESRRMRLASLDMWPDAPYLDNTYEPRPGMEPRNGIGRFVGGLSHDDSHLEQIGKIVEQARAARS
jgi:hypothetical protein